MTQNQLSGPSRRQALTWSVAALTLTLAACSTPAAAPTSAGMSGTAGSSGSAGSGAGELFDPSVPHQLSITWADADFKAMIAAYSSDDSKDWMTAELTLDGTVLKNVGVRLKGNSTLRSLGGTNQQGGQAGGPQGGGAGFVRPDMGTPPDGAPGGQGGGQGTPPDGGVGGLAFADSAAISADDPTSLPLLIRFDKYVDGQQFQGLTQLALRPGSPVINEALALALTAATEQPTQRFAYTQYSVNGSKTSTRLIVENPDEAYAERLLDGSNVLYKADAESNFSYQGDAQKTYEDQFKQLNKKDSQNLSPIINFLKWLDAADSNTFDAALTDWVDVQSLARYCATSNLLANSDDMAGPGQNYYLGYNVEKKLLQVISWDLNLALNSNPTASPEQSMSMGGGRGGNTLKSRFLASSVFKKLYETAYQELFASMYTSGEALTLLAEITAAIPVSDGLSSTDISAKSTAVQNFVQQRTTALEKVLA